MDQLIFISFTREEGGREYASHVRDTLLLSFAEEEIFFDEDQRKFEWPYFEDNLQAALVIAQVVVAVMHPGWEDVMSRRALSRSARVQSDLPYMCRELQLARRYNCEIVPVAVGGAGVPKRPDRLLPGAQEVMPRHIHVITKSDWDNKFANEITPRLRLIIEKYHRRARALRQSGYLTPAEELAIGAMHPFERSAWIEKRRSELNRPGSSPLSHQEAMQILAQMRGEETGPPSG